MNGALNPKVKIHPGALQRWRLFNATHGRLIRLSMRGQTFELLAQDGNTLRKMRPAHELLIGPGSRAEVLVRGEPRGRYSLNSLPFHACFRGCLDPRAGIGNGGRTLARQALLTLVSGGGQAHDRLPGGALSAGPPDLRKRHVDRRRTIVLARMLARDGPPTFPLSKKVFNADRTDITMKLGSVEEWTLKNTNTGTHREWHTFHIHQNPFQIVSVNGRRPGYVDYQDNVVLAPGDVVVIRTNPLDFTGRFVFHCHLTFHEDNGMMGTVQVVRRPTKAQARAGRIIHLGKMVMASSVAPGEGRRSRHGADPSWLCRRTRTT